MGQDSDEKVTSCEGDSGSPVIRKIEGTAREKPYYQQEYVVSTGLDCNLKATIYARVSNREILTWIQDVTNTYPLVVVIGGFSKLEYTRTKKIKPKIEPGPDNDIEIVSRDRKCQKGIAPVNLGKKKLCDWACQGKSQDDPTVVPFVFADSDVLGHTAQYSNDAPIYCGGKSRFESLNLCWEYDYKINT